MKHVIIRTLKKGRGNGVPIEHLVCSPQSARDGGATPLAAVQETQDYPPAGKPVKFYIWCMMAYRYTGETPLSCGSAFDRAIATIKKVMVIQT